MTQNDTGDYLCLRIDHGSVSLASFLADAFFLLQARKLSCICGEPLTSGGSECHEQSTRGGPPNAKTACLSDDDVQRP